MHATDDEKIMKFREKLRLWMGKLGVRDFFFSSLSLINICWKQIQTDLSIHDKVEAIISERMLTRSEEAEVLRGSKSNSEPFEHVGDGKRLVEKPLPQIIVSDSRDAEGSKGQTGTTEEVDLTNEETSDRHSSSAADEDRKKKREEERIAKKAERERWRRSAQEFRLLPLQETNAPDERPSRPASVASFGSQAHSFASVQLSVAGLTSTSKTDGGTDRELALQLQAQLAKEIEEEDEKKALEIGIALHHQWEAEEKARTDKQHLESDVQLRTPDSMDSRSLKPQTRSTLSIHQANQHQHALPGVTTSVADGNRPASPIRPASPQSRARAY